MSEIQPQITYSPDGTLTIQHSETEVAEYAAASRWGDFMDIQAIEDKRTRALELISELPGAEVGEGETPKIVLPIREALKNPLANNRDEEIEDFLNATFLLTLVKNGKDTTDRVVGFPELTNNRLTATIYHHFQGWFNSSGVTEEVAKDCITALAVPYRREQEAQIDFTYWQHNDQFASGRAGGLQVAHRKGPFTIERIFKWLGSTKKHDGHVDWKSLDLETYGDACLGVDYDVHYDSESKKLYRIYSYNVHRPRQTLSLLLGLGSLAHHSSQDMTEHAVYTDVQWGKGMNWPFNDPVVRI